MIELFKNKQYRRLILCFAALDSSQMFLLITLWGWFDVRGSRIGAEIAFIVYSAVIVLALMTVPLFIIRKGLFDRPALLNKAVRGCIAAAFASLLISFVPGLAALYIAQTLATGFIFISHAVCMARFARELPQNLIGRAVGFSVSITMLVAYCANLMPTDGVWVAIEVSVFAILLAVSAFFFSCVPPQPLPPRGGRGGEGSHSLPRWFFAFFAAGAFCYAMIAGLDDNLAYYIDPDGDLLALSSEFIYSLGFLIYPLAGYMIDRYKNLTAVILSAFAAILLTIAPLLFTHVESVAFFYTILGKLAIYVLWVACIAVPIRLGGGRTNWPGFGYAVLYAGMALTSILFLFLPEEYFDVVFALIVIFALAGLLIVFYIVSKFQKENYLTRLVNKENEVSQLTEQISLYRTNGISFDLEEFAARYSLTQRESELLISISGSLTVEEIAAKENLSAGAIKYHVRNILNKTKCKNRRELRQMMDSNLRPTTPEY